MVMAAWAMLLKDSSNWTLLQLVVDMVIYTILIIIHLGSQPNASTVSKGHCIAFSAALKKMVDPVTSIIRRCLDPTILWFEGSSEQCPKYHWTTLVVVRATSGQKPLLRDGGSFNPYPGLTLWLKTVQEPDEVSDSEAWWVDQHIWIGQRSWPGHSPVQSCEGLRAQRSCQERMDRACL